MLIINLQTNEDATKQGQWWNINYSHFLLQKMAALWRVITECGYRDRLKDVRVQYTGRFAYVVQALVVNVTTEDQFHGREDRHDNSGNLMVTIGSKDVEPLNNGYLPSLAAKMSDWIRPSTTDRVTFLVRKGKRKVEGMGDIAETLAAKGHDVHVMSFAGQPIGAQMHAMMASKLVIACHGAELANAVFLRPGAALLEIMPFGFDAPYYGDLCNLVGARHRQLWGTNPPEGMRETCESLREQTRAMSNKRFALREVSWINVEPAAIIEAAETLLAQ